MRSQALALTLEQPRGLGGHDLCVFGNTFVLRDSAETVGKQQGENVNQPAVCRWTARTPFGLLWSSSVTRTFY